MLLFSKSYNVNKSVTGKTTGNEANFWKHLQSGIVIPIMYFYTVACNYSNDALLSADTKRLRHSNTIVNTATLMIINYNW